jgi:uncharacterized membrane protein
MNSGIEHRRTLFNLAGYILIFLLLPVPVFAQGPVDLTFGETGMFPWTVTGIMPGDHGSTFIDLHNNGTERGLVYLWVDNISSSDRNGNPGGGLANYLYFDVAHKNLSSTVILPARIHSFPAAPLITDHFIIIDPLNAGDTVRLNWTWEFIETGLPQNDAQNNTLRFNLSYTLVNLTAPVVPTPVPTAGPPTIPERRIVIPQGPSIFDAGSIAGLNPFQRPQLRGPTEEPPETGARQQNLPDHGLIMIIASIVIAAAVAIHSQQKKHPAWKQPADILLVVGTVLTFTGTLYQSYLISIRNGQHLTGTHSTLGLLAIVLLTGVLILWNHYKDKNESQEQKNIWIVFLWVVTTILCIVLGLRTVGIV